MKNNSGSRAKKAATTQSTDNKELLPDLSKKNSNLTKRDSIVWAIIDWRLIEWLVLK